MVGAVEMALGLVIVAVQVEQAPPEILGGARSNPWVYRVLALVWEEILVDSLQWDRLVSFQTAGKAAVLQVVLGLDY